MATLTRPERLAHYLDQAQRTPFAWGRHDCLIWLANWVFVVRDVDPAAGLRGSYTTAVGAAAVLACNGGMAALVGACCRAAGLAETGGPVAGDIGVVQAVTRDGLEWVGGICTGPRWALLSENGLVSWRADPAAAWSV